MPKRQVVQIGEVHKAALRAHILDTGLWESRYASDVEKDGSHIGYSILIWFTLETALRRRFSPRCQPADVIRYVADLRMTLAENAGMLDPGLTEAIIRSLLGDASLMAGLPVAEAPEKMLSIGLLLLTALVNAANLDEVGVGKLIDEAAANAEQRTKEDVADTGK